MERFARGPEKGEAADKSVPRSGGIYHLGFMRRNMDGLLSGDEQRTALPQCYDILSYNSAFKPVDLSINGISSLSRIFS